MSVKKDRGGGGGYASISTERERGKERERGYACVSKRDIQDGWQLYTLVPNFVKSPGTYMHDIYF